MKGASGVGFNAVAFLGISPQVSSRDCAAHSLGPWIIFLNLPSTCGNGFDFQRYVYMHIIYVLRKEAAIAGIWEV